MHFFYADESGSTGRDLANAEQPVFVIGGISVRDKGWNQTREKFEAVLQSYFDPDPVPEGFELHTHELLSPEGEGPFAGHLRMRRNQLVNDLLDLLDERRHDVVLIPIDKARLAEHGGEALGGRPHLDTTDPYSLAFDQYVSAVEKHVRDRLGSSARAMAIIDEHEQYPAAVDEVIRYRRRLIAKAYRVKWIVEFAYPVDSRRNPMVQLSDLVICIARRFFEVDGGYRGAWTPQARNQYRRWYARLHGRRQNKSIVPYADRAREEVNNLMERVWCKPSRGGMRDE